MVAVAVVVAVDVQNKIYRKIKMTKERHLLQ